MTKTRTLPFILASVFLIAAAAFPEERHLSLQECLDLALKNNPEILSAGQALEAARGRSLQSQAWPNPELSMSAEGQPLKKNAGESEINVGISQLFEFPGKRSLRMTLGKYEEDAGSLGLERTKALVLAKVKLAYFKAAASQQRVRILEAALEDLKSYSALAQAKYAALQTSSVDVSRGTIEELKVKAEIVEARRGVQSDVSALTLTMGLAVADPAPRLEDIRFSPMTMKLDDALRESRNRPSLRAAALRLDQARAGISLARKSNLPDFKLGFLYPSLRTAGWGISLDTSLPLFGKKQKGEVQEAEAIYRQSEIRAQAQALRVETSLKSVFAELSMLQEKLSLYNTSLFRETETLIQSALKDYQFGKLDSLGLLDFYRTWRDINREYLDTLLRYVQAAAELEIAGEEDAFQE
jgi:cobalt-zinc-cadmium efflux system outer membrane protein